MWLRISEIYTFAPKLPLPPSNYTDDLIGFASLQYMTPTFMEFIQKIVVNIDKRNGTLIIMVIELTFSISNVLSKSVECLCSPGKQSVKLL